MVIVHRDNDCYDIPDDVAKRVLFAKRLRGRYDIIFEKILKSNNISYTLTNYENYSDKYDLQGDYFVARFAQEIGDKVQHSQFFDRLYNFYGENMWPNKNAYYYYDDKIRQNELLKKYNLDIPSIICNNLDEVLKNITIGTVIKSTNGAGADCVIHIWKKEQIDSIEEYISNCYNKPNTWEQISQYFFPCIIQEYVDFNWEYHIFCANNEIYGYKKKLPTKWNSPNSFPYNNFEGDWVNFQYNDERGNKFNTNDTRLDREELDSSLIKSIVDIKNELNTPNLKFDIVGGKVLEFSYIYGEQIPYVSGGLDLFVYNCHRDKIEVRKYDSHYFQSIQQNSVLKHLGIIK